MGANEQIRLTRFAGSWYPAQPNVLDSDLSQYLKRAKEQLPKEQLSKEQIAKQVPAKLQAARQQVMAVQTKKQDIANILAIIVPHAGYMFSGQTAAFAYQSLSPNKYKRVFLLGPSHHVAFKGAALPSEGSFATPLGDLQVDAMVIHKFLKLPYFQESDMVFDSEHSLEMQLPWIRKTLGNIKLIPLAIGVVGNKEIKQIVNALMDELTEGDLIVISSDFTHYGPRFDYQPFSDEYSLEALQAKIKELDFKALDCLKTLDSQTLLEFYERSHDTICGIYPCAILLSLLPANTNVKLLKYATSQDVQKDPDGNSVSYMAIVCSSPDPKGWLSAKRKAGSVTPGSPNQAQLSENDGKVLLKFARTALQDYLQGKRDTVAQALEYSGRLNPEEQLRLKEKRGVFVTLYKKPEGITVSSSKNQEHHKELRGCIGYIYPNKPLLLAVCENAVNAAVNDPRFNPVAKDELDHLTIEISVLTVPHFISNWQDIKLGQDGIVLHKSGRQSVFLPKVATEFGWDLPQTLSQLSLKAGLSLYDWQQDAQFEVFQSQSFCE